MNLYCCIYKEASHDCLQTRGYFKFKFGRTNNIIGKRTKQSRSNRTILSEEYLTIWFFMGSILTDEQVHKMIAHLREVGKGGGDEWFRFTPVSMDIDLAIEELCHQLDLLTGKDVWRKQHYLFGSNRETAIPFDQRIIQPKKGSKKRAEEESKTLERRLFMIEAGKK